MDLALETRKPSEAKADVLVLGRYAADGRPPAEFAAVDRALGGLLSKVLASEKFEGKPGQLSYVHTGGKIPAERVLVVGLGPHRRSDRTRADAEPMRRAVSAAVRRARDLGAATVAVFVPPDGLSPRERAQAIVEGGLLGTYRFEKYLKEKNGKAVRALTVLEPDRRSAAGGRDGRAARADLGRGHLPRPRPGQRAGQRGDAHLPRRAARARSRAKAGSSCRCWTARSAPAWAWAPTSAWPRAARSRPSSSI